MKILERSAYVIIGTVDLATEKVRDIPSLQTFRESSVIERLRDIEPRVRGNVEKLSTRGEKVFERLRTRAVDVRQAAERLRERSGRSSSKEA